MIDENNVDDGTDEFSKKSEEREVDEAPNVPEIRDHVISEVVRFMRALRRADAEVPVNAGITALHALVEVGFEEEHARTALQAALITRSEDIETFEQLFPAFWRRLTIGFDVTDSRMDSTSETLRDRVDQLSAAVSSREESDSEADRDPRETDASMRLGTSGSLDEAGESDLEEITTSTYSPTGTPSPVAVNQETLVSQEDLDAEVRHLTHALVRLQGRRWARHGNQRMDTRQALRESFGTGGTIVSVPRKEKEQSVVRCILCVDVSQSVLDIIDREFLIRFLRTIYERWRNVRVFFFDDHVREVTARFDATTTEDVLAALRCAETEWGGGTRIGHAIETIRYEHPDAVDRNTVVFVISDGLEVGELDRLEEGITWLSRRAATVFWLNPLASSPAYEPRCRGMATSLPYVDGLFSFADREDIAEMARQLHLRGTGGELGYKHDPRRYK